MKKIHVGFVAVLLGVATVLGVLAATRTAGLGAAAGANVTSASIADRARRLDRVEAGLRRALRDRPPTLPAVPASARPSSASAAVIYRRPAPIVVLGHTAHADDGAEHEQEEQEHESDD